MRRISDTIARLTRASGTAFAMPAPVASRLTPLTGFGANPGALTGWYHVPAGGEAMPLVVVLHGCTQNAAGYDRADATSWRILGKGNQIL